MSGLQLVPFSAEKLAELVCESSGAAKGTDCVQARYLGTYLSHAELQAKSIIIEPEYIDRHWLDEYQGYYANRFVGTAHSTTRLHFFDRELTEERLQWALESATTGNRVYVERALSNSYLGFVVVRPLPAAPIGRTVLRAYTDKPSRCFESASSEFRVHIAGLELTVKGLPFQQQDSAAGACATTAMWSSLARVMRMEGDRPPTPFQVTEAATRYLRNGRPYPNVKGLEHEQMLEAVRELGFSPVLFSAADGDHKRAAGYAEFLMAVRVYLRSGIPVVLTSFDHAVAAVGYRESDQEIPAEPLELKAEASPSHVLRFAGLSRLYIHDDRFGPYGRFVFLAPNGADPVLQFTPNADGFKAEAFDVTGAIAPLYPKIRLTATELIAQALELLPFVGSIVGADRDLLTADLWFTQSGRYLRDLGDIALLPRDRHYQWMKVCRLPRYVGVIRFLFRGLHVADFVCDTTDMRRNIPTWAPVLALVAGSSATRATLEQFARVVKPTAQVP